MADARAASRIRTGRCGGALRSQAPPPATRQAADVRRPTGGPGPPAGAGWRSEEHTSELQSLMRISYAVFCLKKKIQTTNYDLHQTTAIQLPSTWTHYIYPNSTNDWQHTTTWSIT